MAKPRYSIVRVNTGACPHRFEDIQNETVCYVHRKKEFCRDENLICTECYYGDTKEQLIRKVAQVILRKFLKGCLGNAMQPKLAKEQIEIVYKNYLELAKEIVEFLGVEK